MPGKKGYKATDKLQKRDRKKRGGRKAVDFPKGEAGTLADEAENYLTSLDVHNYTDDTIEGRRHALKQFLLWAHERDLCDPDMITKPILESYQRHLWNYRKTNGKPLAISSQRGKLGTIKDYFKWLTRQNILPANPASEIELPRPEKRLPEEALTIAQINAVLAIPDIEDPLGLRDRAILETFYSCAIRRSELARLELANLNQERGTLQIRQGKGRKDRVVPIGETAMAWMLRYLEEARPKLAIHSREKAFFLSSYGEAFNPDVLSRKVSAYIKKADLGRGGSCHLLRHTCATHMHDNGADIRYIQQLLGHEKLETTAIYTEVSIEQLRRIHRETHPGEQRKPLK